MPDSESFEAFYSRTVGTVTSQMHALAGDDSTADHAIREAYARAYQQWYEIAGYPDTEGWVLAIAKEAFQRRRAMAAGPIRDPARPGHDPLSMPGMFRPAPVRSESAGAGAATVTPPAPHADSQAGTWFTPAPRPADSAEDAGSSPARGISGVFGGRTRTPRSATATAQLADNHQAPAEQPAQPGRGWRSVRLADFSFGRRRPSVILIALAIVVALAAAGGVGYLVAGSHPAGRPASSGAAAGQRGKPGLQMLGAGRTGALSAVPWRLINSLIAAGGLPGWTLAEVSTAAPGPNGKPKADGSVTTYLVDPQGGKYQIQTSAGPAPVLLGWSGDAQHALLAVPHGASSAGVTYDLLSLTTGGVSVLPLPPGVTAVGFTRPDGLNILAVSQTTSEFKLERFNLQGSYQATIASLPRKPGTAGWQASCGVGCGALSSPDGLTAVWGVAGDEMQLVWNNAAGVIRKLAVPGSGSPSSCVPLTWWNANTVLASCFAPNSVRSRLWLVPTNGTSPTALTDPSGSSTGAGVVTGAWQGAGGVYVTKTDARRCASASSGSGGLALATASGGSVHRVSVGGTTNNHTVVVSALDGRLLVLAQTSCPGTSALLWLNPATGATQTVLSAPGTQVGVVAAAPYGLGPTAVSGGLTG